MIDIFISTMEFQCDICSKTFSRQSDLKRHKFTIHGFSFFSCNKCDKEFNRKDKFVEHCRKCVITCKYCDANFKLQKDVNEHVNLIHTDKKFVCTKCEKKFATKRNMQKHQQKCTQSTSSVIRSPQPGPSSRPDMDERTFRCRRCTARFANRRQLYLHGMQHHYQTGAGGLQSRPWTHDEAPWEVEADGALKTVYEANAPIILENHSESSVTSTYNVPLTNDFTVPQLMEQAERLYDRQGHAFRLNLEFGLILRNVETGEYRYFRAFANESLFERPVYISRRTQSATRRWANVGSWSARLADRRGWRVNVAPTSNQRVHSNRGIDIVDPTLARRMILNGWLCDRLANVGTKPEDIRRPDVGD